MSGRGGGAGRAAWVRRAKLLAGVVVIFVVYAVARRLAFGHDSIGYNLWTDDPAWRRQAAHWGWLVPLLPFGGNATPMTYMAGGKQYVVIGTSGGNDRRGPQGSAYVAYALGD